MRAEPRPEIRVIPLIAYGVILVIGLVVFGATFDPMQFLFTGTNAQITVGTSKLSDTKLVQEITAFRLLVGAFAVAMITVSLFELLKTAIQFVVYHFSITKEINTFFGEGATKDSNKARIILQEDSLENVLKEFPDTAKGLNKNPDHRLHKARSWVNRFDIDAARAIIRKFRDLDLAPPDIEPTHRNKPTSNQLNMPFRFVIGLGHTDEANKLINTPDFNEWLQVVHDNDKGDMLKIHQELIEGNLGGRLQIDRTFQDGFVGLYPNPQEWNIDAWLNKEKTIKDYAVILRHTMDPVADHPGCVNFWVGGFTEHGTAAAGYYLADNWERLSKEIVRRDKFGGCGDFMIVIEGLSHKPKGEKYKKHWDEILSLRITPKRLYDKFSSEKGPQIKSAWTARIRAANEHNK